MKVVLKLKEDPQYQISNFDEYIKIRKDRFKKHIHNEYLKSKPKSKKDK